MIRFLTIFALVFLAGIFVQATLLRTLVPAAPAPDFTVVLVCFLALRVGGVRGLLGAFVLGLLADFASAQFLGPCAAGATVAYLLVVFIASHMYADRAFSLALLAFMSAAAKSLVYVVMLQTVVGAQVSISNMLGTIALEALLTAVIAPFLLALLFGMTSSTDFARSPANETLPLRIRRVR